MNSVKELIEELKNGRPIVLVDDEDRENEGDLVIAGQYANPFWINFMARECRGLICLAMEPQQVDRLQLPQMVPDRYNQSPYSTAFTVSIEASEGVTTGISAADRARTVQVAIDPHSKPKDIVMPGHIFPLRAQPGGVLKRAGHSEGSVDLVSLAGLNPSAVICEILNEDGTMARVDSLKEFCQHHDLKIGSIASLIDYRLQTETLVEEVAQSTLPLAAGKDFRVRVFRSRLDGAEHVVLQKGEIDSESPTLVRVHSECMTGDVFGSQRCDCGQQLQAAIDLVEKEGKGIILYLRQEGRGIGLSNKIKAYELQDGGMDTVDANIHLGFKADQRDYGIGAQILRAVGAHKLRLLTNNPAKRAGLKGYGLEIVERIALQLPATDGNLKYMKTKKERMGHLINLERL